MEQEMEERASYEEFIGKLLHRMSLKNLKLMLDVALKLIDQKGGEHHMTAREEFNMILNSCSSPRTAYNILNALAHSPCINQGNDASEKRAVGLSKLSAFVNQSGNDQSIKQAV